MTFNYKKALKSRQFKIVLIIAVIFILFNESQPKIQAIMPPTQENINFCGGWWQKTSTCLEKGCVIEVGITGSCKPCLGLGEKTTVEIFQNYPGKYPDSICCSGNYLQVEDAYDVTPWSEPGLICKTKDDPYGENPGGKVTSCTKSELKIGNIITKWFPGQTCKTRFYMMIGVGIFGFFMIIAMM